MNVSLTPVMEKFVHDQVKSGLYSNASEVVRMALRGFMRQEKQQKKISWPADDGTLWPTATGTFAEEIQKGVDALARGEYATYPFLDDLFNDVRQSAKTELQRGE